MKHYLITDHNQDGFHEYYDHVAVESSKPKEDWHDNWENFFLSWQFGTGWIDEENGDFWSDDRIVRVDGVKEITEEEYKVFCKHTSGFGIDLIIKQGKERWDENKELQQAWDKYNEED